MLDHLLPQRTNSRAQSPLSQEPIADYRPEAWSAYVLPDCKSRSARGLCEPDLNIVSFYTLKSV